MLNQIPIVQMLEPQLKLLRARTRTYSLATRYMVVQLCLTVLIPVVGAIWAGFDPRVRTNFAALALLVLIADPLWLDRRYKALLKRAARICERFDCTVLEMRWNQFVVGDSVDVEDIHRAATKYTARHKDDMLVDWYPVAAGEAPLHLARLICQRTNLRYDSQLRRYYSGLLIGLAAAVAVLVGAIGLFQSLSFPQWVLTLASLSPLLNWSIREYYRQQDTADQLEDLMKSAKKLWELALSGECLEPECTLKTREFQDAIYARRVSSPLIVPLIYKLSRSYLEDEMNNAANDFLAQYLDSETVRVK
jgi:hypothetical protein